MRALRRPQPGPLGLAQYSHGRNIWKDVDSACRAELWARLDSMQHGLCAYCEADLARWGRHLEHHCPRSKRPQTTFEWDNLLGSCDAPDTCGCFKDSPQAPDYQCGELIDPAAEDPDVFFVIRDSGRIEPRPGLTPAHLQRAERTLAVLNLNLDRAQGGRSLCAERRRVLQFYLQREPDILNALVEFEPQARAAFIADEVAQAAQEPFGSILRHFFEAAQ